MSNTTQIIATLRETAATIRLAAQALRGALSSGASFVRPLRPLTESLARRSVGAARTAAACLDGACSSHATAGPRGQSTALPSIPASAISAALSGDFARALQGMLRSVIGQLTRGIGASMGGGIGGNILSSLLSGGLSFLLGRLFRGGGMFGGTLAAAAPVPLPALRSFPQLALSGYASAPASALFGQRAVPRGPGISVSVEYKRGADDFVVAKVAQRLAELNSMENI